MLTQTLIRAGYNVTAVDAPAHGQSGGRTYTVISHAQAIEAAIRYFKPEIVIGHSAGGMAAVYSLAHFSQHAVKQLVLIATPSTMFLLIENYQRALKLSNRAVEALIDAFEAAFEVKIADFATSLFIQKVDIEGLVIHDKQDSIADYYGGLAIHQNWPQSKMLSTEGLGHSLRVESVNEAILGFLEQG